MERHERGVVGVMRSAGWLGVAAIVVNVQGILPARAAEETRAPTAVTNLAAAANGGHIVRVTSELDKEFWVASHLLDGEVGKGKGWASKEGPEYPQDIVIGFKDDKPHLVNRVTIHPDTGSDPAWLGRWAKEVEVLVSKESPDEKAFKPVASFNLMNVGKAQTMDFRPVDSKYVMVRVKSNQGSDRYVGLGEVEIYEAIVGTGELDQLISRLEQLLTDLKKYRDRAGPE